MSKHEHENENENYNNFLNNGSNYEILIDSIKHNNEEFTFNNNENNNNLKNHFKIITSSIIISKNNLDLNPFTTITKPLLLNNNIYTIIGEININSQEYYQSLCQNCNNKPRMLSTLGFNVTISSW